MRQFRDMLNAIQQVKKEGFDPFNETYMERLNFDYTSPGDDVEVDLVEGDNLEVGQVENGIQPEGDEGDGSISFHEAMQDAKSYVRSTGKESRGLTPQSTANVIRDVLGNESARRYLEGSRDEQYDILRRISDDTFNYKMRDEEEGSEDAGLKYDKPTLEQVFTGKMDFDNERDRRLFKAGESYDQVKKDVNKRGTRIDLIVTNASELERSKSALEGMKEAGASDDEIQELEKSINERRSRLKELGVKNPMGNVNIEKYKKERDMLGSKLDSAKERFMQIYREESK